MITVSMFRKFTGSVLSACLLWAGSASSLHAQQGGAEAALHSAMETFNSGDYKTAAQQFEEVVKNYPTSAQVPLAQMRAGYANFLAGDYAKAEEFLRKILAPPAPETAQEIGHSLLPQVLAAAASELPPEDKNRATGFEDAIKQFGVYLQKYPKGDDIESAYYGRALSYFQIKKYDESIADLRHNLTTFAKSATISDSQYLLSLVLATKANSLLQENKDATQADSLYAEAEKLLLDLYHKRLDIAQANNAIFQVAEMRFNHAILTQDPEARKVLLHSALDAYRLVEQKDKMVQAQENRLEAARKQQAPAIRSGNQAEIRRVQRLVERESSKLEELRKQEDLTLTGKLKTGQIFFQLEDYDATRIVMRQIQKFNQAEDAQKSSLYFITMTYGLQNEVDKALSNYDEFQSKYKGAPIAENLSLTIGAMLNAVGRAEDAIKYLAEQNELYPNSKLDQIAVVQQANAFLGLKKYDEALKTYEDYLQKNPNATPDTAVQAVLGIANVYKEIGKWDEAIAQYQKVVKEYPSQEAAVQQASFWIGFGLLQKGDAKAAIPQLKAFLEKYPQDKNFGPGASFTLAQAQQSSGDLNAALETYQQTEVNYPGTEAASFAFFQRAGIFASSQKTDELIAEMKAFIEQYPKDNKLFAAYDSIGQNEAARGNADAAIENYVQYAKEHPESAEAPQALLKISDLRRGKANAIGRYLALNDDQRKEWDSEISKSTESAEQIVNQYPDSPVVALALQSLLENKKMEILADKVKPADIETYFQTIAAKFESNPAVRSKIIFTLASYVHGYDEARALELMTKAYSPDLVFTPDDLDLYAEALVENKKLDDAEAVFNKIAKDYPIPAGIDPTQADPSIQIAQAIALYGQGLVSQERGNVAEAGKLFERLKTLYPWSPKLLEASYGIAAAQFAEGKGQDALPAISNIVRAGTSSVELKAKAMLLGGNIQAADYEKATDPKDKTDLLDSAIDYYTKIALYYEGVPKIAAEGLWKGGQLLEQKAANTADAAAKTKLIAAARNSYKKIVEDFPQSPNIEDAKKRLAALGGTQ